MQIRRCHVFVSSEIVTKLFFMLKREKSRCAQLFSCNMSYNYIHVLSAPVKNSFSGVRKMSYCLFRFVDLDLLRSVMDVA